MHTSPTLYIYSYFNETREGIRTYASAYRLFYKEYDKGIILDKHTLPKCSKKDICSGLFLGRALLCAFQTYPVQDQKEVVVYLDDEYFYNVVTRYISNWKSLGWKTTKGSPPRCVDMWRSLYRHLFNLGINVKFYFVYPAATFPGNDFYEHSLLLKDLKASIVAHIKSRSYSQDWAHLNGITYNDIIISDDGTNHNLGWLDFMYPDKEKYSVYVRS
jgi:hypothetical protein